MKYIKYIIKIMNTFIDAGQVNQRKRGNKIIKEFTLYGKYNTLFT
jgi:hypothetical protein